MRFTIQKLLSRPWYFNIAHLSQDGGTSRHRQASCASSCSSFVPYWKSPKLYRQLWTSQVLISVPSLLCWNANSAGKSAQRALTNIICMLPRTLVKCRSILRFRMISCLLKIDLLIFQTLICQINKFCHQKTQTMTYLYHLRRLIQIVQNRRATSSFRTICENVMKI